MLDPPNRQPENVPPGARFIAGVFGFVFFGIGLMVLVFLWGTRSNEFGAPPLFFRVFGSFIALAFVAMGGTVCLSAILGKDLLGNRAAANLRRMASPLHEAQDMIEQGRASPSTSPSHTPANCTYVCPHCGAPLAEGADVSPHGDSKCRYCNTWFNIHGKR